MPTKKLKGFDLISGKIEGKKLIKIIFSSKINDEDGNENLIFYEKGLNLDVSLEGDSFYFEKSHDIFVIGEQWAVLQIIPSKQNKTHKFVWKSAYFNSEEEIKFKVEKDDDGEKSLNFNLTPKEPLIEIIPGHAEIQLNENKIDISISKNSVKIFAPQLILSLNLFHEKVSNLFGIPTSRTYPISLKLTPTAEEAQKGLLFEFTNQGVEFGDGWNVALAYTELDKNTWSFPSFGLNGVVEQIGVAVKELNFEIKNTRISDDGRILIDVEATLSFWGGKKSTVSGSMEFTRNLILANTQIFFKSSEKIDLLDANSPFSVHIKENVQIGINLDSVNNFVSFSMADNSFPAEISVPGRNGDDNNRKYFVLDVTGDSSEPDSAKCRITSQGLMLSAVARPIIIEIGDLLPEVRVEEGSIEIFDNKFTLSVAAVAQILPNYFDNASGKLTLTGTNSTPNTETETTAIPNIHIRFEPQIEGSWINSNNYIQVDNPRAWVEINWTSGGAGESGNWEVDGGLSGSLYLNKVPGFGDAFSNDFLKEVFGSLQFEFENLNLYELTENIQSSASLAIKSGREISVRLWDVLQFELKNFKLGFNKIEFGGKLNLDLGGGTSFSGELPNLIISWIDKTPEISSEMAFGGTLTVPSGLQASVEFKRKDDEILGSGSLSIPGLPMIKILCGLGKKEATPLFMLYAQMDYPVTLFPGVVLRDLGLGIGINKVLRGFEDETAGLNKLLGDASGLANPARLDDWVITNNPPTISLIASSKIAPSPTGEGLMPYVGEVVFSLQISDEINVAFITNLWLFTELQNTRKSEYMSRPVVKGVMVLYPRYGRLEGKFTTSESPKMDAAPELFGKALDMVRAEVSFLATPDVFKLRIGPVIVKPPSLGLGELIRIDLQGKMVSSVEVASGNVLAMAYLSISGIVQSSWTASLQFGTTIDFGVIALHGTVSITIKFSLRAEYSDESILIGESKSLKLYGKKRIHLKVDLVLYASFTGTATLEIDYWFDSYTQTFSTNWSASATFSLSVEADVESLIDSGGMAIRGEARLNFSLCGFSFNLPFNLTTNPEKNDEINSIRDKVKQLGVL